MSKLIARNATPSSITVSGFTVYNIRSENSTSIVEVEGTSNTAPSVGDIITFGNYPQSTSDPEPIEWTVLDVDTVNHKCLLISDKILAKTYIKAITYAIIIFKDLVGFLTLDNCSGFSNYGDKVYFDMTLLKEIASSALSYPIFEATHLSSSEMFEIYRTGQPQETKKFPVFPWSRGERGREYTTWKMTSRTAFFRPSLFEKLSTLSEDYIESFTWNNIKYFLASACEYLGVKRINHEIFELNVNRLSDYVDAAGKK